MKLVTWNIQWARGVDGRVDLDRVVGTARALADFDVLCLQEVVVNFPALAGSSGENQVERLARLLPGYSIHYGVATDVDDGKRGRSLFGNAICSRLPVPQVFRHLLPWPAEPGVKSMRRAAVEAVVTAPWGPVRVATTHLEYYSAMQRLAQVNALRALHREACGHAASPRAAAEPGPFEPRPRPASAILTGDFNFQPGSPDYEHLVAAFDSASVPDFVDAWAVLHGSAPHAPTAGVHENSWADPAFCCDFVFTTADLAGRLCAVTVDANTQASDHQPVMVEFGA